jgi:hypothetical protein
MPQFEHLSVNHSLNFVDPNDATIHTQNIEGLWSRSKYFLRKNEAFQWKSNLSILFNFCGNTVYLKEKK